MRMPEKASANGCKCHWVAEGSFTEMKWTYTRTHVHEDCTVHGSGGTDPGEVTAVEDMTWDNPKCGLHNGTESSTIVT